MHREPDKHTCDTIQRECSCSQNSGQCAPVASCSTSPARLARSSGRAAAKPEGPDTEPEGAAEELAAVVSLKLLPSSLPGIASAADEESPGTSTSVLLFFSVVVLNTASCCRRSAHHTATAAAQRSQLLRPSITNRMHGSTTRGGNPECKAGHVWQATNTCWQPLSQRAAHIVLGAGCSPAAI